MKSVGVVFIMIVASIFLGKAQVFVGGGASLSFTTEDRDGMGNITDATGLRFGYSASPQVGFFLNDRMSMGVDVFFGNNWIKSNITDSNDPINSYEYKYNYFIWSFYIFGQYQLMTFGTKNLSLLVKTSIGVSGNINKFTDITVNVKQPGSTVYSINARPVLSYKLSDRLDILASSNFLTFGYNFQTHKSQDPIHKLKTHNLDLGFNSYLGILSIGIIYKF